MGSQVDKAEVGPTTSRPLRLGVVNLARQTRWCDAVLAGVPEDDRPFDLCRLPPDAAALASALATPGAACDGLLIFVTPDSTAWAARVVRIARDSSLPSLLITRGFRAASIEALLTAGASDFIPHSFDPEELRARIRRLLPPRRYTPLPPHPPAPDVDGTVGVHGTPAAAVSRAPAPPASTEMLRALARLIGDSPAFRQQTLLIPTLASCHASVLVLGETGTGKELFAQAIHYASPRAKGPWVAVNCAALPAELVESELFGHARGAYTSAHRSRDGLIAQSEGGTLFLDEVDSLPLASQAKLLRFLQEKEYRAVGTNEMRHANVRVVAATNADLAARAASGAFRCDLYFRLNVLSLKLPALRDRPEDIVMLAQHFVSHYAREFGRAAPALDGRARASLQAHAWPGNVRELEHAIERAVLLCQHGRIGAADLDLPLPAEPGDEANLDESFQAAKARSVEAFERHYIEHALQRCHGNISHAAAAASKNRRAFWQLMRKHHIDASLYRID